jgi:aromatic-L-amino-acid decarboxylase
MADRALDRPTVGFVTPDEFRSNGHLLIDWIADYIENVEHQRVVPDVAPGDVRARLPEHPPPDIEPFASVMTDVDEVIVPGLTHW